MKLPLSNRLLACADFVRPGAQVADVGCDHGYLSIHLLTCGKARSVIAADINPQPLASARQNAEKHGVEGRIRFYLSDGVQDLPKDFDTLICAGMGADTMISILSAAPWLRDEKYRIILQCQSKVPMLRQWLYDAGYDISEETLAKDGKFVYSILAATYAPGAAHHPVDAYLSPALRNSKHPLLPEYLSRVKNGIALTTAGLSRTDDSRLCQYQALLSQLTALEETIYDHRC